MKTIWLLDPAYWTAPWGKQNSLELSNTGFNHDHKPDTNIHTSLFACFFFFSLDLVFVFFIFPDDRARRQIIYPLDQLRGNAPSERILKQKVKRDNLVPQILRFILCSDAISKNWNV